MPSARPRIYLAYGSNLHPRRLENRVGPVELIGTLALRGWRLAFDKRGGDGSAKANLRAVPGSSCIVHAAAYGIRHDQLSRLDRFEGCGRGYDTFPMHVSVNADYVEAFTYLATTHWISKALAPYDWYVDLIVAGARFHGFDEAYIERLLHQQVRRDPRHERARGELNDLNLPLRAHYEE